MSIASDYRDGLRIYNLKKCSQIILMTIRFMNDCKIQNLLFGWRWGYIYKEVNSLWNKATQLLFILFSHSCNITEMEDYSKYYSVMYQREEIYVSTTQLILLTEAFGIHTTLMLQNQSMILNLS